MHDEDGAARQGRIETLEQTIREFWDEIAQLRAEHDGRLHSQGKPASTNKELAEAIGVPDTTFGDWATKRSTVPAWHYISELVDCLGGNQEEFRHKWSLARSANEQRNSIVRKRRPQPSSDSRGAQQADPSKADVETALRGLNDHVHEGSQDDTDDLNPPVVQPQSSTHQSPVKESPGDAQVEPVVSGGPKQRWQRMVTAGALVVALVGAVSLIVALVSDSDNEGRATPPTSSDVPTATETTSSVTMRIDNTWSAANNRHLGACASKSPLVSQMGACYDEDFLIKVVCWKPDGAKRSDATSQRSSTGWVQLADGEWLSDLYVGPLEPSGPTIQSLSRCSAT